MEDFIIFHINKIAIYLYRESFSLRIDFPCSSDVTSTTHPLNNYRRIRLSNRYDNQTKVIICLKGPPKSAYEEVANCRRNVLVNHHHSRHNDFPKQPKIPKISVMNIPQPIEDVSFWENIVRYVFQMEFISH